MQRELDKVINRIAWQMARTEGQGSARSGALSDGCIAMLMAFKRDYYLRMAEVAYHEIIKIDEERQRG